MVNKISQYIYVVVQITGHYETPYIFRHASAEGVYLWKWADQCGSIHCLTLLTSLPLELQHVSETSVVGK